MSDNRKELKMAENENVQTQEVEKVEEAAAPVNPLLRSIELRVAQADAMAATEKALRQYGKNAKVPGFRKGHVPMAQLRAMYGARAFEDAVNTLINQAWGEALKGIKDERVIALVTVQPKESADKDTMVFDAQYEVLPTVEMPDFSKLELKRLVCPVGEAEVEQTIDVMRRQRAVYEVREGRAAEKNDRVKLNYKGTKDGEEFRGGSASAYVFELGQGRMLPEFEEAVTGMKAGEKKTFPLTFPSDYGIADLNGAQVEFEVEVLEVSEPIYPEINDEFAKSLGVEGGVEAMRADILANLKREVAARLEQHNKALVMNAVSETLDFPLPKTIVDEEVKALAEQAVRDFAARGMDTSKMDLSKIPTHLFQAQAEHRVRLSLFLGQLVDQEKIVASDDDVREQAEAIASSYEDPKEVVDYLMKDASRMNNMRVGIVERKVTDYIFEHAKTSEETVEFDKLMAGNL